MLFRTFVSRKSADKGRAVLERLGLDASTISYCFSKYRIEEAVQEGLVKWSQGRSYRRPTWNVLVMAMEYAQIPQQDIQDLKQKLGYYL